MDATIAIIFAVIGLTDMAFNDCPTSCIAQADADQRFWIQAGATVVDSREIRLYKSNELVLGYDFGRAYGPFQPMASVGMSMDGDVWVGAGVKWRLEPNNTPLFFEGSFQPGFHFEDEGPDLGGNIHFRSALGVGYEFNNGSAVLVSFDHRSNGDLFGDVNPGMEAISVQYSLTFD